MSTNRNTGEGGLFSIFTDNERTSGELVIQHGPVLEDLQILIADVLDSGNDPQVRHGRNFVGGSRERNLKAANGTNRGFCVGADGRKSESND